MAGTNHSVLSDVCVCACVLSVWILVLSGSLRVYEREGEPDQNLLTVLISATHIFECDGDATWSLSPEL